MKHLLVLFALALLMAGCGTSPKKQSLEQFEDGIALLDRFDYAGADAVFSSLSESDTGSVLGLYGHGLSYERQLMYLDALDIYMIAARVDSSFAPAMRGVYRILNHFEIYEDAQRVAVDYARLHPEDPDGILQLAHAYILNGLSGRALQVIDDSRIDGNFKAQADLLKALALFNEARFDSADSLAESVLSDMDQTPATYMRAADYLETAGLIDSAVSLSFQAVALSDYDFDFLMEHFYRSLRNRYFTQARKMIDRLLSTGGGDLIRYGIMTLYNWALDEKVAARSMAEKYRAFGVQRLTPSYYELLTGAPLRLESAIKDEMTFLHLTMQKRKYDEGFQVLVRYLAALAYAEMKLPIETLDYLYDLPGVYGNRLPARVRAASALYNSGQAEEANRLQQLLVSGHKQQPEWLTGVADVYGARHVRAYDKARTHYTMALDQNKWYLPAFTNQVEMNRRLGQTKEALQLFSRYPHFETEYPSVALLKSMCLVEAGRSREALDLFKDNIGYIKGNLRLFADMMDALKGDSAAVGEVLTLIKQFNEDDADALVMIARFYSDRDDFARSLPPAERALRLEPQYVSTQVMHAYSQYGAGEKETALETLDTLLAHNPADRRVNFTLSQILVREGIDLGRASNLARRALFSSFMAYDEWMNLCHAYYRSGRFDLCRGEAIKASRKFENSPGPLFWMGMAQYRENNQDARDNLQKAIDLGLVGDELTQAREALAQL